MQLAERLQRIALSPTLAVLMEAERYKARGVDVVDFGAGEPDFPTPDNVKQAAIRAIHDNFTKYTATGGIAELRQAICDRHAADFGTDYRTQEALVCVGGKHAIFNAVAALVNPGDEVILPVPYWVSFPDIIKFAGGKVVPVETHEIDSFQLRADAVEKALTPRTRLVIVNSPNNPSGAVVDPKEFERILELCRQRDILLISDECYSHFVYEGQPFSIAAVERAKSHTVIIGSLSKTYAMTGWRIGYALAPERLIHAMLTIQSHCTSNPTSIAQRAAAEALLGPQESVVKMLAEYSRRRRRILQGLRLIQGVKCVTPQGAFYVYPNVKAFLKHDGIGDTLTVARALLEQEHIAVVPGEAFGTPGYLRLSYATSMERIEEGLRRLERFFARLAAS
ncbi:MAG TPA: pyridoxal phosphate-dependent aminotransferase [Candidatus Acidoferrales bacterium]